MPKQKKEVISKNYLEKRPLRHPDIHWFVEEEGKVVLTIENTGVMNRIAQKLFKKPKTSYIHLDENGSFIWPLLDGEKNIIEIGKLVDEQFGEKAYPLYERLAKFFQVLDSYHFIEWKES